MDRSLGREMTASEIRAADEERVAALALRNAGPPEAPGKTNLLAAMLSNLINALLAILGIPRRLRGGSWKPPAPRDMAKAAAHDEAVRQGLDEPREILRVARRIHTGAEITSAKLSEPVMGALLTMPRHELATLIAGDMNIIAGWAASERGEAARVRLHASPPEPDFEPVQRFNR